MSELKEYYGRRANEFEDVYHRDDPTRQRELATIASDMKKTLHDRRVLEVACGTGYWTSIVATVAEHVTAVDISQEVLALARAKQLDPNRVEFLEADAYELEKVRGKFDAGLAAFWLSHVPKSRLSEFLDGFHRKMNGGHSVVFMVDNIYMPGVGGGLATKNGTQDTYKIRELSDGSTHVVLKNYYTEDQLKEILSKYAHSLIVHMGECYWWLNYTT
jgi:ubiquinone/menaquinone biosynthesis C-methylase UbiE